MQKTSEKENRTISLEEPKRGFSASSLFENSESTSTSLERSEWKYRITEKDEAILKERLSALLEKDEHQTEAAGYIIHSLYFDDVFDSFAQGNEGGDAVRHKYRIRYYDRNTSFMKLEKKTNWYGFCRKEAAPLTFEDYEDIMNGEYGNLLWRHEDPLIRKFCAEGMAKPLFPRVIVEYQRIAFFDPLADIRITFDKAISASAETGRFLEGDFFCCPLLPKGEEIFEVKFDAILPGYLKSAITTGTLIPTAFSKYYLSRMKLRTLGVY